MAACNALDVVDASRTLANSFNLFDFGAPSQGCLEPKPPKPIASTGAAAASLWQTNVVHSSCRASLAMSVLNVSFGHVKITHHATAGERRWAWHKASQCGATPSGDAFDNQNGAAWYTTIRSGRTRLLHPCTMASNIPLFGRELGRHATELSLLGPRRFAKLEPLHGSGPDSSHASHVLEQAPVA